MCPLDLACLPMGTAASAPGPSPPGRPVIRRQAAGAGVLQLDPLIAELVDHRLQRWLVDDPENPPAAAVVHHPKAPDL